MKKIENVNIVLENKVIFGDIFYDEKITKIIEKGKEKTGTPTLIAGFIDNHIHGSAGFDVMDSTIEAITGIAKSLLQEGTTSFLPTTITNSIPNKTKALKNIHTYYLHHNNYAKVLGIHLEGPFINPLKKGAQPLEFIIEPNLELFNDWQKESGYLIKKISLAPEMNGAYDFIKELNKQNLVTSIAHSNATFNEVLKSTKLGLTSVTHMFNALSPFHHRDIGATGAGLLLDELHTELILDFIHVSKEAAKLLIKTKTPDRVIVITDSMRAKGLSDGISELGGQTVYIKDGMATLKDGTLAGSILKMIDAFKNMLSLEISLVEISKMMSLNAAKELNLASEIGSIKEGKIADFVLLDQDYNIIKTIVSGKTLYERI